MRLGNGEERLNQKILVWPYAPIQYHIRGWDEKETIGEKARSSLNSTCISQEIGIYRMHVRHDYWALAPENTLHRQKPTAMLPVKVGGLP